MTAEKLLGELTKFTRAYLECALWASMDESDERGGKPLDKKYGFKDFSPELLERAIADCKAFQKDNAADLVKENFLQKRGSHLKYAGHDFWLTRNGHGAGFWDGDWKEPAGTRLTQAAHAYGACDIYVGDDGLLYFS